jgi:hypothetical protein
MFFIMEGRLKQIDGVIENIANPELRKAIQDDRVIEWAKVYYRTLSPMDVALLSAILTCTERYEIMEALSNPEGDPIKSLSIRDSFAVVPYFLSNLSRYLKLDNYEEVLIDVWTRGEAGQFHRDDWVEALGQADPKKLRAAGDKLPQDKMSEGKITAYRGASEGYGRGFSWTLSQEVAEQFALMKWRVYNAEGSFVGFGVNPKPVLYQALIPVEKIIWYSDDRSEQELIVRDLPQVKIVKRFRTLR